MANSQAWVLKNKVFQIKEQDMKQDIDSFAAEMKINQKILFL